jgi:hypothetical protein
MVTIPASSLVKSRREAGICPIHDGLKQLFSFGIFMPGRPMSR